MNLPSILCEYSYQKMDLNSSKSIPVRPLLYSGNVLYLSNSFVQSSVVSGGKDPVIVHEVMERPDSVSLVSPPINTIVKVRAESVKKKMNGTLEVASEPLEAFFAVE